MLDWQKNSVQSKDQMPVSMLGNLPKQQIKGAVFNCVNLNKWWENLYFKLTPSER